MYSMSEIPVPAFEENDNDLNFRNSVAENSRRHILPVIDPLSPLPSITAQTVSQLLRLEIDHPFDKIVILDCRYPHEFSSGHIYGAINLLKYDQMVSQYKSNLNLKTCFIFHCEFSQKRGPSWMSLFRNYDRNENKGRYPQINHPNIYLLHGGFKEFSRCYSGLCTGPYLPMDEDPSENKSKLKEYNAAYSKEMSMHSYFSTSAAGSMTPNRIQMSYEQQWKQLGNMTLSSSQPSR